MNGIVYHIASGQAFFTGLLLVSLAVALSQSDRTKVFAKAVLFVGVIAIALTSTPLTYWFYGVGIAIAVIWQLPLRKLVATKRIGQLLVGWCVVAAIVETPNTLVPIVQPTIDRKLIVVGDSVTAGMGGSDTTKKWPTILAQEHSLVVQDLSHPGATAASALKRVSEAKPTGLLVLVEIGGNDVLGTTSPTNFNEDLGQLIEALSVKDRQLVMLELPLIPFYHEYGRIQRSVARQYDVKLVPKAQFLGVIAKEQATVDSIHLTQKGHELMSKMIWQVIEPAYR